MSLAGNASRAGVSQAIIKKSHGASLLNINEEVSNYGDSNRGDATRKQISSTTLMQMSGKSAGKKMPSILSDMLLREKSTEFALREKSMELAVNPV